MLEKALSRKNVRQNGDALTDLVGGVVAVENGEPTGQRGGPRRVAPLQFAGYPL